MMFCSINNCYLAVQTAICTTKFVDIPLSEVHMYILNCHDQNVIYFIYTCQLFLSQRREIFNQRVPGFLKTTQHIESFPKTFKDVCRCPKTFQRKLINAPLLNLALQKFEISAKCNPVLSYFFNQMEFSFLELA